MTKKIEVGKSSKYMPIAEGIINAIKNYEESFTNIAAYFTSVKQNYSDSDYPYCLVYISNLFPTPSNIPKGTMEEVNIEVIFEVKSYSETKTNLSYKIAEDFICLINNGISFDNMTKYKIKALTIDNGEIVPNTDGSFMFETVKFTLKGKIYICSGCKEESE